MPESSLLFTSFLPRWKAGKRKAEKDALIGGSLFMAVRRPEKPMDQGNLEHNVHVFTTFQTQLDGAVKASCSNIWKRLL